MKKENKPCPVCTKQTPNKLCARCRGLQKRYIYSRHLSNIPDERQYELIRYEIKRGASI